MNCKKTYKKIVSLLSEINIKSTCSNLFLVQLIEYFEFLSCLNNKLLRHKKQYDCNLQRNFNERTNSFLKTAYLLEKNLPTFYRIKVRDLFRKYISQFLFESKIFTRFFKKPCGYPGDYMMFEMMYDNKVLSEGIGEYFDNYIFDHQLVRSVVNRKDMMKGFLKEAIVNYKDVKKINILNVASGSSREVRELFFEFHFAKKINFTLLDQDSRGLKFFKRNCKKVNSNINIQYVKSDILSIISREFEESKKNDCEMYDIIYSLGLVDYFRDNLFERFLQKYLKLLRKNGKLFVAVCSSRDLNCYVALRWFCEWNFYYREFYSTISLLKDIKKEFLFDVQWEKNQRIFFLIFTKN